MTTTKKWHGRLSVDATEKCACPFCGVPSGTPCIGDGVHQERKEEVRELAAKTGVDPWTIPTLENLESAEWRAGIAQEFIYRTNPNEIALGFSLLVGLTYEAPDELVRLFEKLHKVVDLNTILPEIYSMCRDMARARNCWVISRTVQTECFKACFDLLGHGPLNFSDTVDDYEGFSIFRKPDRAFQFTCEDEKDTNLDCNPDMCGLMVTQENAQILWDRCLEECKAITPDVTEVALAWYDILVDGVPHVAMVWCDISLDFTGSDFLWDLAEEIGVPHFAPWATCHVDSHWSDVLESLGPYASDWNSLVEGL